MRQMAKGIHSATKLRNKRKILGVCVDCKGELISATLCAVCLKKKREWMRAKRVATAKPGTGIDERAEEDRRWLANLGKMGLAYVP